MVDEFLVHVTPAELHALQTEVLALVDRYHARNTHPSLRPEGSRPVEIVAFGYPYMGAER
jgi:hypothetical protein